MKKPPKYNDATPVIFRMLGKEVIAIFPTIPGDRNVNPCQSYMHVGQHGSCTIHIGDMCRLATPREYMPLKKELTALGYRLRVIKRIAPCHRDMRIAELNKMERNSHE